MSPMTWICRFWIVELWAAMPSSPKAWGLPFSTRSAGGLHEWWREIRRPYRRSVMTWAISCPAKQPRSERAGAFAEMVTQKLERL